MNRSTLATFVARKVLSSMLVLAVTGLMANHFHRHHDAGGATNVARALVSGARIAVGADAGGALPVHRHHRRLDHGRGGPPAVADLRPDAHARGRSPHVSAGNALFTLIGFMGMYTVLGDPLPVPGVPRDRARADAAAGRTPWKRSGSAWWP